MRDFLLTGALLAMGVLYLAVVLVALAFVAPLLLLGMIQRIIDGGRA